MAGGSDSDLTAAAIDAALDDITMPDGVYRIVAGRRQGVTTEPGYVVISLSLVVVPTDTQEMFCMAFAMSSKGELIAEPAPGDPINRCADTDPARFAVP